MNRDSMALQPAELDDIALLNLRVQGRFRGDMLVHWQPDKAELLVLFDGKSGYGLENYRYHPERVALNAEILMDDSIIVGCCLEKRMAGFVMLEPNIWMSYFHQVYWGSEYKEKAVEYNRYRTKQLLADVWEYCGIMNFAANEGVEGLDNVKIFYEAFNEIICKKIKGLQVHIPLIINDNMPSLVH